MISTSGRWCEVPIGVNVKAGRENHVRIEVGDWGQDEIEAIRVNWICIVVDVCFFQLSRLYSHLIASHSPTESVLEMVGKPGDACAGGIW